MNKVLLKKIVAVVAITILFLNLLFVGLGMYSHIVFWAIIVLVAVVSLGIIKLVK